MNRTFLALLLAFAAAAQGSKLAERADKLFEEFKEKFHKKYESVEEEIKRKAIFLESMKRCDAKNERNGSPAFGVTKFSDLSEEEFSVFLGRKGKGVTVDETKIKVRAPSGKARVADAASGAINWVHEGKVTPVKNQGQCGSCWAFSAAEQVESAWTMAGHPRWEFSPQQIASCTPDMYGCGGGDTVAAYEYLMGNSTAGLANAWFAPYVQSMYDLCESKKCTESCDDLHLDQMVKNAALAGPFASVTGYEYATPPCYGKCKNQDTTLLANNVAEYGPASICVNAASWGDYTGGVLKYDTCGDPKYSSIDHCVQLVGFNATASSPYWIVKNSWSIDWGENGYILLEYPLNTCALADEATFVNLKSTQDSRAARCV